ncbi:MAG: type I DNA topoisomerase [Phycisphaerales bacterium]|nr:type I DNA topoisomerase [Phycisphaerales bacterium]
MPLYKDGKQVAKTSAQSSGPALVIVESPAKAKTINKYLGSNFEVRASMGHVRDLPEKGLGVDVENNFAPTYEVLDRRQKLIGELRAAARRAGEVYLATDLDREGEAIAWHLAHALNLPERQAKRVVFNEITKTAILKAFERPHTINLDKVNAQQARRILDRLMGYKISPLLWKKVARGLSAGRVQSVALKIIVDREREIAAFMPEEYWKVAGVFTTDIKAAADLAAQWQAFIAGPQDDDDAADDGTDSASVASAPNAAERTAWLAENSGFKAQLVELDGKKFDPKNAADARRAAVALGLANLREQTVDNDGTNGPRGIPNRGAAAKITTLMGDIPTGKNAPTFAVRSLNTRPSTSRPPGPFSTSTLQQAASNQLGFGAQRTMRVAQQLYEGVELPDVGAVGLITYMRTDSQNLSNDAIAMARGYIQTTFGKPYLPETPNVYASRQGAQEAHEAIRPTDVTLTPASVRRALSDEQFRLYDLVWKRFVACQMTPAQWLVTDAIIECRPTTGGDPARWPLFKASGRALKFDGFTRVAGTFARFDDQILPNLSEKQPLAPLDISPSQHFTAPPPRFSEASLVKALETEGIGRPSTYASIIETIEKRQYVEIRDRRFFATDLGIKVTEKLIEGFPDLMDLGFTRKIESELDQIEEQHRDWIEVIRSFYDPMARDLATAEERMTHARAEATPSEYKCPKCGAMMAYKLSKRGKRFLSCSRYPECDGATNVDREGKPQPLEITDYKCPTCGKPMIKRTGRFGPFFGCSGYPECKTIQQADRKTGLPLPPKPPPKPTGLTCPRCGKKELVVRGGKRGEFISCSGYPKCRMTLQIDKLPEYLEAKEKGQWPTPDVLAKAAGAKGGGKAAKVESAAAEPAAAVPKPAKRAPKAAPTKAASKKTVKAS